jgi:hypothetical protein
MSGQCFDCGHDLCQCDGPVASDVVCRIEVFREDDGRYAAEFRAGDGRVGGMGNYAATPIGALAELCATLIKVAEDQGKVNAE